MGLVCQEECQTSVQSLCFLSSNLTLQKLSLSIVWSIRWASIELQQPTIVPIQHKISSRVLWPIVPDVSIQRDVLFRNGEAVRGIGQQFFIFSLVFILTWTGVHKQGNYLFCWGTFKFTIHLILNIRKNMK